MYFPLSRVVSECYYLYEAFFPGYQWITSSCDLIWSCMPNRAGTNQYLVEFRHSLWVLQEAFWWLSSWHSFSLLLMNLWPHWSTSRTLQSSGGDRKLRPSPLIVHNYFMAFFICECKGRTVSQAVLAKLQFWSSSSFLGFQLWILLFCFPIPRCWSAAMGASQARAGNATWQRVVWSCCL